jgi:hypothetical protein
MRKKEIKDQIIAIAVEVQPVADYFGQGEQWANMLSERTQDAVNKAATSLWLAELNMNQRDTHAAHIARMFGNSLKLDQSDDSLKDFLSRAKDARTALEPLLNQTRGALL